MKKYNSRFPAGFNLWQKIRATFYRIVGCDHPSGYVLDIGDEDTSMMWFCFRCGHYIGFGEHKKK
jgi:hypothetical protein